MLYCLLRRKTMATYTRVFRTILHLEPGLSPVTLLTDFEQAAIQAFRAVFPAAAPSACFFHLKQSVQRKVEESGLASLYSRNSRFREAVQLLPALAFLRPEDIGRGKPRFEELQDHIRPQGEQEAEVFDYFERTYIGVPFGRSRTRRDPPFAPSLWSCHYRVQEELPKTNNSVEGWHHSLQSSLGFQHPDPYRLIAALKAEQSLTEQKQADARRGIAPRVSKPAYARIAERLQAALVDYVTTPLIDTLLACRFASEM
ncbi:hypothetical protein HPB48_018701 [Haemaphysalis longicornis]|uniref:MULE transposase domain-containing protein n=1 Tax=Haemaphysalis longicornis TaxID=44386 RepID=A0A9J6GUN3_HAELO|nr:hypothetical protein HPB48_018701 [Haemaphysalis longicornis]